MKLSKLKEKKTDFENCLANLPEASELSSSNIRNGDTYWSYECRKGDFLYLLGEEELYEEDKADYCVRGFAIKESDIKKQQSLTNSEYSITPFDDNVCEMIYVVQSYKEGERWNKQDVLNEMELWLEDKVEEFDKRIENALKQRNNAKEKNKETKDNIERD